MEPQKTTYDVVVVGGGAAGLVAALFTSRRGLKTIVISQDIGGQAATTPDIENYPGIEFVDGLELMHSFKKQAEKFGTEIRIDTVLAIESLPDNRYAVKTNTYTVEGETVILAFGLSHRHLNVPGEDTFVGKGVSYCSICDARFYKGKRVAVVGGGSSAVQSALILSQLAAEVTLVNLNDAFRTEAVTLEKLNRASNIKPILNAETKEVVGDKAVTGLVIHHKDSDKTETIPVERVFVEIGYMAKADWIKQFVKTDARNQIIISQNCETNKPGVFAAGDITTISFKQVVISAGEGAKAALQAHQYILQKAGKRGAFIDWGTSKRK
jgi:thioredoxin-disulfide reductase